MPAPLPCSQKIIVLGGARLVLYIHKIIASDIPVIVKVRPKMPEFKPFTVLPRLPESLAFLQTLASNVWWSWNADAYELIRRIDPSRFRGVEFNPVALLAQTSQGRLDELAKDAAFLASLRAVEANFKAQAQSSKHWKKITEPRRCIGYFSMEFGLHESIHIYSGGLGILAGDHLKSASDLDIPLVGVGLFYREGYFEQSLGHNGYQHEDNPENDIHDLPVTRALTPAGAPLRVSVPLPEGRLCAAAWRLDVGRVPLILLDTNIPENPPELRSVTGRLYGGDKRDRIRQEILLGIGGMRALEAMGFEVAASHMNEGHAAFLGPERIAKLMRGGLSFDEALEMARSTSVFTTHTPVPAGNETFDLDLIYPHLNALEAEGGLATDAVVALGRAPGDNSGPLSMTILGLSCSASSNGVAKLHGIVERDMWRHLWPEFPVDEVPIKHVTNGIHVPTWLASANRILYSSVLGPDWDKTPLTDKHLGQIDHLGDEELWRVHESSRAHLIRAAREHLERCYIKRNESYDNLSVIRTALDKDTLTIGFARRFATYKRATLLLSDIPRLKRILLNPSRPVQIVFAGKAHPADGEGKHLMQQIVQFARDPEVSQHVVFLENYNMHIARRLVRGVDVWLNTPRLPNEASGTSGMKACINGAIHVSTLDGWWPEGYTRETGWAIGDGTLSDDWQGQDYSDAQALYNLLESEIVPTFYDRPHGELPSRWIRMMKESIKMSLQQFSSTRMVAEYFEKAYSPALDAFARLAADGHRELRADVDARARLKEKWGGISLTFPELENPRTELHVGDKAPVTAIVRLGDIPPAEVEVELFIGELHNDDTVHCGDYVTQMKIQRDLGNGEYLYKGVGVCHRAGAFGCSARVVPQNRALRDAMPGHMVWAK